MQPSRRTCLWASLALLALLPAVPRAHAETLTITSTPAGAAVEIDGSVAGVTPYETHYPGGYFHKTHTAFGERLAHAMILKISMDGYWTQHVTLTDGPFEWVAITGRRRGNYFLLRSDHFSITLEPVSSGAGHAAGTSGNAGPLRPASTTLLRRNETAGETSSGSVKIESEPAGAEIYIDGKFVGQTPATLQLATGSHRIEMKFPGRKDWQRDLDVLRDGQLTLHPILEPSP
ncbi:MAG TPA: PEGA domain-containing protein [Verrucomicrobiae bacterium]|nr:PEGA domain-containing protein [Verrucomicrobiae bacterium]